MKHSQKLFKSFGYAGLMAMVIFSLVSTVGCGGGDGGGGSSKSNNVVVGDVTRTINAETVDQSLTAVSEDGQTLVFADTPEIQVLESGDIIVSGISDTAPQGFLKRITGKRIEGGEIILETEPAALADAIKSGSFSISEPLMVDGDSTEIIDIAEGVTFVDDDAGVDRAIIDMMSKKVALNVVMYGTSEKGISVEGSLELTLCVDLDFEIRDHSLEMLKVVPQLSNRLEAKVIASVEGSFPIKEITLFTVRKTKAYLFGYFLVVVTYEVPIYLQLGEITAEVGIEAGAVATLDIKAGFVYQKGRDVEFVRDVFPGVDWIYPTVYGKLTGKVGTGVGVGIILYGTAGIEGILSSGLKLELEPRLSYDPCLGAEILFKAALYSSMEAEVDFTVFDHTLWDRQFDVLSETEYLPYSNVLSRSNESPVVSIDSPASDQLFTGTAIAFSQTSSDPDGVIASYRWDFGDGLSSTSAQASHAYQNPGQNNVTLTVEDNDGCSVSDSIAISVLSSGGDDGGGVNTYYRDADSDGYGAPGTGTQAASAPAGYVGNNRDCDDTDQTIYPGAAEVCGDGKDNNCDGQTDENCSTCTDADGDGYYFEGDCSTDVDCDDVNDAINPGTAEICSDGIDNNCDGQTDEGCASSAVSKIPDTEQITCYDADGNILTSCPLPGQQFYGQDACYIINPCSYTKLDSSGNDLPDSAVDWAMVRDNVTGLIWEVKNDDGGIHDKDNTYKWWMTTDSFISQLNNENFGGFSDWRMPKIKELSYTVNYGHIMDKFFNTVGLNAQTYWSANLNAGNQSTEAWCFIFSSGRNDTRLFSGDYCVRAVRGGEKSSPPFTDNNDGTVTDNNTGLLWMQKPVDINEDGVIDDNDRMNWRKALDWCENLSFAGYSNWRLPNLKELNSIVAYGQYNPAINTSYFLDTISESYWTSTSTPDYYGDAWTIYFYNGLYKKQNKWSGAFMRAVRGGQ